MCEIINKGTCLEFVFRECASNRLT